MNEKLTCNETAEYVSALCDGEIIPPEAAAHIGACEICQQRLNDYVNMGVELRRVASFQTVTAAPSRTWTRPQNVVARWWQKGLESVRIPKLAFAALMLSVLALASTLTIDKVRAHDSGTVVLLTVRSAGNKKPMECALSTVDKKAAVCAFIGGTEDRKILGYRIDLLGRDGDRVQLGIRTRVWPAIPNARVSYSISDLEKEPQRSFWFEPGDPLNIDVAGIAPLIMKGNWLDHVPAFVGANQMDPGPDELRIISPLLLRDKQIAGDLTGGATISTERNSAAWVYYPKEGSYLISLVHLKDGIKASVNLNRISFDENSHSYSFVTGTPITRAKEVWVQHQPDFDPHKMGQTGNYAFIASTQVIETAPDEWVPHPMPK